MGWHRLLSQNAEDINIDAPSWKLIVLCIGAYNGCRHVSPCRYTGVCTAANNSAHPL
jgi:hypothetical protein